MNRRRVQQFVTLMVAVIVLAAVAWSARTWTWVRDRREIMSERRLDLLYEVRAAQGGRAPSQLSWFGEPGYERIELEFQYRPPEFQLSDTQRPVLERYRSLFPEAKVIVIPDVPTPDWAKPR